MVIQMDKKTILDFANKKEKTFDQMASMHFKLSDTYKLFSTVEDTIEVIISVLFRPFSSLKVIKMQKHTNGSDYDCFLETFY